MRLIFAGTPDFARVALEALVAAGHEIALVLTRPDQPAGRGRQLRESPVKRFARDAGLALAQPSTLRGEDARALIERARADAMVVAAYGLIVPAGILSLPRLGCINIHASLLPRWRGAAPIQRAIEAGDARTGITIMQMDEGLDTGPILLAREIAIAPDESAGSVHDRLAELGGEAVVEALAGLASGALSPRAQPGQGVRYAHKIAKADAFLDWREPAERLANRVRALDPAPGAAVRLERSDEAFKLWRATAAGDRAAPGLVAGAPVAPGTVLRADPGALEVACGEGVLSLRELQRPGGRRLPVAEFLRGYPIERGERFACPG